ncbi:MAG TPA: hypothetical protein VFN25_04050 [Dokdonella sp.]|uniref:hypothetical protein n=1 Tax=Dokdonella sp. TaxID=2291710 RepID=UPI002D7FF4EB|nr:hypothetical protein [Dokdonella sp.]HET9032061.1 hypothetical protein [Dokdonella sp.]
MSRCLLPLSFLSASLLALSAHASTTPAFEVEPVLGATSFVQPALLSGPGFQVDPHVEIRGYMARFTIDTRIGPIEAESIEILHDRIAEMPALEALDQLTHSDAFLGAAAESATNTATGIGQVLWNPIKTLVGFPAGVARYFGKRRRKIGNQAQSLSDRTARELGSDGNPYPRSEGPMTEAREIDREQADYKRAGNKHRWYDRAGAEGEREIKRQLKYGKVRRELAERLGIDPYTSNPYLRERLDQLAWAGSGGHYAASIAVASIGGIGGIVIANGSQLNELVWKLDPDQLRDLNAQRLSRWCSDNLLMRQFLRRGTFTPTLQLAMLDALDQIRPEHGCNAVLELAMTAQSELEARYIVNALGLIAHRLGARANGGTLLTIGAGLAFDSVDGERTLPLPVDYLTWTDEVAAFIDSDRFDSANKTILVSGTASLRSQQELTARGWNIVVDAKSTTSRLRTRSTDTASRN